jgi:hypothetical protein
VSGETESDVSGLTPDLLNRALTAQTTERDLRFEQRFLAQERALEIAIAAERDHVDGIQAVVDQRFTDIDRATRLLNDQMTAVPTDVDKQVGHLKEVVNERFSSVALQFAERDTRGEREARDNTIKVDAAFSSAEKSSAKQDESNQKAIDKSEKAFVDALNKLQDLFSATTAGLSDKLDDQKDRLSTLEKSVASGAGNREGGKEAWGTVIAIGALVFTLFAAVLGAVVYLATH